MAQEEAGKNIPERKKAPIVYYFIIALIPILFFVLLELGLWLADYGTAYRLFIKPQGSYNGHLYVDPTISNKYFGNLDWKVFSSGTGFLEKKPTNGYRVFVMGGSSAQGFPYSRNASFASHLSRRLNLVYPEKTIEVVNLGTSAINSYTLLDILPQVLEHSPDLILLYAGHNEYYGALGPGSSKSISPVLARIVLNLREFRTVQLLGNLLSSSPIQSDQEGKNLMQEMIGSSYIELNSDTYQKGVDQFNYNLSGILERIKEAGVPVIIGTLTSNLKDHPPFNSDQVDEEGLSAADHFQRGKDLLSEDSVAAKDHFIMAKELDGLRFRAPEKMNEIIRTKAREFQLPLVSIDSIFSQNSPENIAGNTLICDHLHPNLAGHFLMSKSYFHKMLDEGLVPASIPGIYSDELTTDSLLLAGFPYTRYDSLVDQRLLLTGIGKYPFVPVGAPNPYQTQLDNDGLEYRINALSEVDSIRTLVAADHLMRGDSTAFAREIRVFISYFPVAEYPYSSTINFLAKKGLLNDAYPIISEQLIGLKESSSKNKMLGQYYKFVGEYGRAASNFQKAASATPEDPYLLLDLGFIHLTLEEFSKANEAFSRVLSILPDNAEAYHQRGVARFELKDFEGTVQDMSQVIQGSTTPNSLPYLIRGYAKMGLREMAGACEDWQSAATLGSEEARGLRVEYCGAK